MKSTVLVISDGPQDGDIRVSSAISAYISAGYNIKFCNIKEHHSTIGIIDYSKSLINFILQTLPRALLNSSRFLKTAQRYQAFSFSFGIFTAFRTSIKETLGYFAQGISYSRSIDTENIIIIHSHDLGALVFSQAIKAPSTCKRIYDSHELNIFRDRKKGLFRVAINYCYEFAGIKRCDYVLTVNHPIRHYLVGAYRIQKAVVLPNQFYQREPVRLTRNSDKASIVFYGAIVKNRGLEALIDAASVNLAVVIVFFGKNTEYAKNIKRKALGKNVQFLDGRTTSFEEISKHLTQRCWGWCYINHVCLNNRLALPNKFWQYLALGLPVIVNKGGYLDEVTARLKSGHAIELSENWSQQLINSPSENIALSERLKTINIKPERVTYDRFVSDYLITK